jgi:hypothetical protein
VAPLKVMRHWLFGDRPPLNEDERRLVLRAMAVIAVPLATITALILIVAGGFVVNELRDRTQQNKEAIEAAEDAALKAQRLAVALNLERRARENALAWQVYDECVENENQDAANTELFRKVRTVVAQGPPTAARDALLDTLNETIDAREPPGEKDCVEPPRPRPGNEP